jgi:1-phosphofructokinase
MSAPVITVTLNPAIDQTITVEGLRLGAVHRALAVQYNAGGKGVNVASCLADWGVPVMATGFLGAANAAPFEALFRQKGITDAFIRVPGETRTNIKIADRSAKETTDINLPGLTCSAAALKELRSALSKRLNGHGLVVVAGSVPAGLSDQALADLVAWVSRLGGRVVLDCSGGPLAAALAASKAAMPYCIKPNRAELEGWAGEALPNIPALLAAARSLVARGIAVVVVSLGEEGALLVSTDRAIHGRLPVVEALSTVGAGDAMVAGLVAAFHQGLELDEAARLSIAFAAAKLRQIGPHLPARGEVLALAGAVSIHDLTNYTGQHLI